MLVLHTIPTITFALSCSAAFIGSVPWRTKWFFVALALIIYLFTLAVRMLSIQSITKWACRVTILIVTAIAILLAVTNGLIFYVAAVSANFVLFVVFEVMRRWA